MIDMSWRRLVLMALIVLMLAGCNRRGGLQIDDPAPVVSLQDFHGKTMNLHQDLQGKVWLVRFWSLDCDFCDKSVLLDLETSFQKYKDSGFVPVAINVGKIDPADERLKRYEKLTYPMLIDERGLVAKKFGVVALPTSFVVDGKGILREKLTGEAGLDEFETLFKTVLK